MGLPYDDEETLWLVSRLRREEAENSADHHVKLYSRAAPMPTNLVKYDPSGSVFCARENRPCPDGRAGRALISA